MRASQTGKQRRTHAPRRPPKDRNENLHYYMRAARLFLVRSLSRPVHGVEGGHSSGHFPQRRIGAGLRASAKGLLQRRSWPSWSRRPPALDWTARRLPEMARGKAKPRSELGRGVDGWRCPRHRGERDRERDTGRHWQTGNWDWTNCFCLGYQRQPGRSSRFMCMGKSVALDSFCSFKPGAGNMVFEERQAASDFKVPVKKRQSEGGSP
ncbi:hypothetical protein GGR56DRAFT_13906 [Xylariaceae sp. FL0804]|nr:hypothetical protein GGR56DRAFT_13906 [Xylariaceae sp. FL0804]